MRMSPTSEAERRCGRSVMGRSGRGEHRQRAGENRRDGRIAPTESRRLSPNSSKPDRGGNQREQADLRRDVGEAGGRHLRRDGDGRQRQAGDGVDAEVTGTPAGE